MHRIFQDDKKILFVQPAQARFDAQANGLPGLR
jgi:hypothetical protein